MTNTDKLKQISIVPYLSSIGQQPTKEKDDTAMYRAFWRNDTNASVSVRKSKNVWYDHGADKGGSIIDLVMTIKNCDIKEAFRELESKNLSSFIAPVFDIPKKSSVEILKTIPLFKYTLKNYLLSRGISLEVAEMCGIKEVHYRINGKEYYALGFRNDKSGYVLRSSVFKGCTSSGITTIAGNDTELFVFEGVFDYLSLVQLYGFPSATVVVLNSLSNIRNFEPQLEKYKAVKLLTDHDPSSDKEVLRLIGKYPNCVDCRAWYGNSKDINDYLMSKQLNK